MSTQVAPPSVDCCHWYANDVGEPVHVPTAASSVRPPWMKPAIVGGTVLAGFSEPATLAVAVELAFAVPPALVAVTRMRMTVPTSALTGV